MSTRGNNPDPQASRGAARPAAPETGGMVMLARSAAGRMVQAILARLAGPQAGPAARPVRPAALWQQVARRLGYTPPASTPLGTASSAAPARPPAVDLVWRVRPVPPPQDDVVEAVPPYLAPRATPSAFPSARLVPPATPFTPVSPSPSSSAGSAPQPPSYASPPGNIAPPPSYAPPPPGRAAFVPPVPPTVPRGVALGGSIPALPVTAPAPSAPVQRVPLWEQVTHPPVAPAPLAPPIALARRIAYRMGQDAAPPGMPGFTILGPAAVPETPLVWRTRPAAIPPVAAGDAPPAAPIRPRVSLPPGAAVPPPPVAASAGSLPVPAAPVQRMPAATGSAAAPAGAAPSAPAASVGPPSSIQVGYMPGPAVVPAAPLVTTPVLGALAPLTRSAASPPAVAVPTVPVPTRWDQDLVWRVRPAPLREEAAQDSPVPRWSPVAAPVRADTPAPPPVAFAPGPEPAVAGPRAPLAEVAATMPPAMEAALRVVRLVYTSPPPPAPLWVSPAANLATELNRDLIASSDLLARPARAWDQEPVAVPERPVAATTSAPPPEDVTPLVMPLAAPVRAAGPPTATSGAIDLPANPGLFSRLVDRVTSALPLPEPIRHALESLAARPAEVPSAPPATLPIPLVAPPSALAAIGSPPAPPVADEIAMPLSSTAAGALAATPATAPIAPVAAPAPAPVSPAPAPLVAPHPARGTGGFLSALVSRLLGGTPEPSAPAGPAPLDMPWVRPATLPGEPDTAAEFEAAPAPAAPLAAATAVSPAPVAPSAAAAAVSTPPATPPAPGAESGTPAAMLAGPEAFALASAVPAVGGPLVEERGEAPTSMSAQVEIPLVSPAPLGSGGQTDAPAELSAPPEAALVPPAPAPLAEPRPARSTGGFLSAQVSRLLGGAPEPSAPTAGPAPLDMPWVRPATPPTAEAGIAGDFETLPAPITMQRAVAAPPAPPAPPAAAADVAAPSAATPAPGADFGLSAAMPAVPAPGDLIAAPAALAWVSTPALGFDQPAGEIAEAPDGQPWMDGDSMADVLARVQTSLVPTMALSTAGQDGLWSRIWGAFERALPHGGTPGFERGLPGGSTPGGRRAAPPATPLGYAWSAGSPAMAGGVGAADVPSAPARSDGYTGQSGGIFGSSAAYGPTAAWTPAAGLGGRAPLAGRSLADFVPALGNYRLASADPAPAAAPPFDAQFVAAEGSGITDSTPTWMAALDQLYGAPAASAETMPLAAPYGGFVIPAGEASGVLPQDMAWVAETMGFASPPPDAIPARRVWERPAARPPAGMNWVGAQGPGFMPSLPAPAAPAWIGDTESDEYDSDAAAWADVVAAAVDSDFGAGLPALALAGEEQGVPAVQQAASGEDPASSGGAASDLDELANSVYEIIRRRLEVERERDWV